MTTLKPTDQRLRDFLERQLAEGLHLIPSHMHEGIRDYVLERHVPGDFLLAILSNDFLEAAARADQMNQRALWQWACFLHNHVPTACFGSKAKVQAWLEGEV